MKQKLKEAFEHEMNLARQHYTNGEYKTCFHHLERAHILGQRNAIPHTVNHWWMLKVGLRTGSVKEVVGQLVRLSVAGLGSAVGRVPIGNTGGANVGILTPMPIPADLSVYFEE